MMDVLCAIFAIIWIIGLIVSMVYILAEGINAWTKFVELFKKVNIIGKIILCIFILLISPVIIPVLILIGGAIGLYYFGKFLMWVFKKVSGLK